MPEIQDINDFKNDLIRLGNEPEIREQRGESLPEISVPETQSVDDLSALFDDTVDDAGIFDEEGLFEDEVLFGEDSAEEEPAEEELTESDEPEEAPVEEELAEEDALDAFPVDELPGDELFEDELPEDEPGGEVESMFDEEFPEDDFNLPEGLTEGLEEDLEDEGGVFSEEDQVEDFEDDFGDEVEELQEEDEPEDLFSDEELPEDDFSLPEGLTEGFEEDLEDEVEELSEEALPEDLLPDESQTDLDEDIFSGFDDFDTEPDEGDLEDALPDVDEPGIEEVVDEEISDDFGATDFDMDDLDFEGESGDDDLESMDFDTEAESDDSDMFDTSELDEPGFSPDDDSDIEDFDGGDDDDDFSLEDFSLGEIDGDDIEASEFSLGDLGDEFGVDDEEESELGRLEGLDEGAADFSDDFVDAYSDDTYVIPDDEYIELKKTLGTLPRNLKLIIEELIGEKNLSGENLDKLVQALIRGASVKEIGGTVSKITGKKIRIPTQYERRTAEEFEKEKSSFAYLLRKNFLPMFRTAAIAAVLLGLLMFFGYRFVYTPLHAESLYKKGYEEIPMGNNQQANAYFGRAFNEWQKKSWFYKYAESFIDQKQYVLAEEKYEQLLSWYPDERDAVLDYAELEYKTLGKYPEAEKLLNDLLFDELRDYDARLMLGDTYMEWARELDPSKYEDARFNYAKLIEQFGSRDEILFRMLRYFIRTDNHQEAMKLYEAFKQNDKAAIEPDIYAELAGYLIDNNQLEDVREILMKAKSIDDTIPEIHYHLARYFKNIDIPIEEEKALNAAIWLFEQASPLTRTRNGMLIDSYNRYGMVLYEQERYLDAEEYFQKAASNYDEALAAGQIQPEPKYGNIFSNLGDLAYYISGDYDQALQYFEKAEINEFSPPILKYKKGYIHYNNEEYREALVEFYDTAGGFSVDRDLMYSTANTLFNRNDYFLAEGMYTHLLDLLNREYSSITYLLIDEIPEHRALLENMMKVSNNLGVTKNRLYERTRDPEKNAEAMVLLTDSVEYYDKLSRDPDSLVEPDTVNLSYLNSRAIFYPVQDYRLQIYQNIPKDLDKISF